MSIFFIGIIASNARLAAAGSRSESAAVRARGVICQDTPHLSLHQPHWPSWPPFRTIAFHKRSVSAWSSVAHRFFLRGMDVGFVADVGDDRHGGARDLLPAQQLGFANLGRHSDRKS